MKRLAFLATLGLSTCVLAVGLHTEVQVEATLVSIEQTWIDAAAHGDRTSLEDVLDNSFIETLPNGARRSKADVLLAPALPPGTVQTLGDLKVRVLGSVAMVSGVNHYTPESGLKTIDYAFIDLYVRRGDSWRVASSHTTLRSLDNI